MITVNFRLPPMVKQPRRPVFHFLLSWFRGILTSYQAHAVLMTYLAETMEPRSAKGIEAPLAVTHGPDGEQVN